jgi:hypothetical protein
MKQRKRIVSLTYYTSVVEFIGFIEFVEFIVFVGLVEFRESFGEKTIYSEHLSPSLGCSLPVGRRACLSAGRRGFVW